ncbi:MAG: Ferric transporter ATP-binding subunit [Dehalococcoidia bacterium]|nr:Ferric transporter ATP-binding subunit [Dehalococcoidia bacterium]
MNTRTRRIQHLWALVAGLVILSMLVACTPKEVSPRAAPPGTGTLAPKSAPSVPVASTNSEWDKVVKAAQKEGTLTAYSFNFVGDVGIGLTRAFKEKYGIDVNIITGRGASFIERLRTEKRVGAIVGDFFDGAATHALSVKENGLSVRADLPVLKEQGVWALEPSSIDSEGHVIYYTSLLYPIIANTSLLKPGEEPASYYDLLQPRWKGQIVFSDPELSSTFYTVFKTMINRGLLRQDYINDIAKQDIKFVPSLVDVSRSLAKGEGLIGQGSDADTAPYVVEGAPLKAIPMKEGNIYWGVAFELIKDSPHPNAARVFANWLLSADGARLVSELRKAPSVRSDVPNPMHKALRFEGKVIALSGDEVKASNDSFTKKEWVPLLKKR